jgi:hypothetical protein
MQGEMIGFQKANLPKKVDYQKTLTRAFWSLNVWLTFWQVDFLAS